MDGGAEEGTLEAKEEIYKRTSISSIRLKQKKIRIEVNASDHIIGGVLSMEYENRR